MTRSSTPKPTETGNKVSRQSRFLAAWWGSFIGDALAMPVHWYYKRELIRLHYGEIDGYLPPRSPHPDSILYRSRYEATGPEDDILHDQAQYWGKPGVHYHQFLQAGENTLNLKLSALLAESLVENAGYDAEDYARRYIRFMLDPESHRDTYVEEYHRGFFKNHARGKPLLQCAVDDSNISCLAALTPLVLFYHQDHDRLLSVVRKHLALSHKGETAARAGELYAELIHHLLQGQGVQQALFESIGRDHYQVLSFPFRRWIANHEDEEVVGKIVSSACYLEDALPATLYLALKYADDFETGLLKNVRLGGDNCHRGAALGAVLGAAGGCENIPGDWVAGLQDQERLDALGDALWAASEA
ncbi:MAG: ADP-ribosylglycohydrolase family protein [Verrucomicrobiota bacterium]